jgi:hypothetical protein
MFDEITITESQKQEIAEFGYLRMTLDDALELLKDKQIGVSKIARALGMQRSNLRAQFAKGCMIDLYPNGTVRMTRVEEVLKTGSL